LPAVLQQLGQALADGSRCGLGFTAPVALLDALRLFAREFES
jgi:NADH:ubiquinone oxidoreductase subunit F (NADH-binding)